MRRVAKGGICERHTGRRGPQDESGGRYTPTRVYHEYLADERRRRCGCNERQAVIGSVVMGASASGAVLTTVIFWFGVEYWVPLAVWV